MNVIKIRNRKIAIVKMHTEAMRLHKPAWANCNIRKVSTETFFDLFDWADYITVTEKPKYQKINYITIATFCDSCGQCINNDKIKTINKDDYKPTETENMPLERRGIIHYKNKPEKWVINVLEGKK